MANVKHLEILKLGKNKWNEWRENNIKVWPYLPEVELPGIDLSGVNLCRTYLLKAYLHGINLSESDLSDSVLTEVDLSNANLSGANLSNASLSGANLNNANLSGANLYNADLTNADLAEANLSNAVLPSAKLFYANFSETNLTEADLSYADLHESIFINSKFENTELSGCSLNTTVFGLTNLSTCKGLDSVEVFGPCIIDFPTLRASTNLPKEFITKLGIPDLLMEYLPDFYNPALMIYPAFLSHSWADKEFVRNLYEALTKKGVTVWLDEKKMKPGDNIHDSISEGIKYYDKLILVCSENSLNSWWVEKELEKVYEKERDMQKERGKKFRLVIPIRIDDSIFDCKDGILTTVRNSVIGDFTKWQDESEFEKALKELVGALNANRPDIKPPSFF